MKRNKKPSKILDKIAIPPIDQTAIFLIQAADRSFFRHDQASNVSFSNLRLKEQSPLLPQTLKKTKSVEIRYLPYVHLSLTRIYAMLSEDFPLLNLTLILPFI